MSLSNNNDPQGWSCSVCTFYNENNLDKCDICGNKNPFKVISYIHIMCLIFIYHFD